MFHQLSQLLVERVAMLLRMPTEKVILYLVQIENTVSSSIPIALKDASDQQPIQSGDKVMLIGYGASCSWGACLVEW